MVTEERLFELAALAFKLTGYETSKHPDGTLSVRCPHRVTQLMSTFHQLLVGEFAETPSGAGAP